MKFQTRREIPPRGPGLYAANISGSAPRGGLNGAQLTGARGDAKRSSPESTAPSGSLGLMHPVPVPLYQRRSRRNSPRAGLSCRPHTATAFRHKHHRSAACCSTNSSATWCTSMASAENSIAGRARPELWIRHEQWRTCRIQTGHIHEASDMLRRNKYQCGLRESDQHRANSHRCSVAGASSVPSRSCPRGRSLRAAEQSCCGGNQSGSWRLGASHPVVVPTSLARC